MTIRRASPADAQALSSIAIRTFIEAFGHLYPDEDLQHFINDSYAPEKLAMALADEDCAIWLLEDDGEAVGYAFAGTCGLPHAEVAACDGELKRLYVLRRVQNGGWGGRLFETVLQWLQRDGPRTLWIGVWSKNVDAQRFYARYGFTRAGEYQFPVGRVRDDEFILRRPAAISTRESEPG